MTRFILLFLALTVLFSFVFQAFEQRRALEYTINRYVFSLSEGYEKFNMTPLREVATERECDRVYHHMSAYGEARKKIISKMTAMEFLRFENSGQSQYRVETMEHWDFVHLDLDTQKIAQEFKDVAHHMVYTLEKESGKWLVGKVDFVDENAEAK